MPIEWRERYHEWEQSYRIEDDGSVVASSFMDAEPVLEQAKAEHTAGTRQDREFRKVATIPLGLWLQWKREGVDILKNGNEGWLRRKLDDPDLRYLRVWDGKLGKYHLE